MGISFKKTSCHFQLKRVIDFHLMLMSTGCLSLWIFLVAEVTVCCSCKILIYTQMYLTTGRTEPIPLVMKEDTLCLGRLKSEVFSFLAFRQSKLKVNS